MGLIIENYSLDRVTVFLFEIDSASGTQTELYISGWVSFSCFKGEFRIHRCLRVKDAWKCLNINVVTRVGDVVYFFFVS